MEEISFDESFHPSSLTMQYNSVDLASAAEAEEDGFCLIDHPDLPVREALAVSESPCRASPVSSLEDVSRGFATSDEEVSAEVAKGTILEAELDLNAEEAVPAPPPPANLTPEATTIESVIEGVIDAIADTVSKAVEPEGCKKGTVPKEAQTLWPWLAALILVGIIRLVGAPRKPVWQCVRHGLLLTSVLAVVLVD